MTWRPPSVGLLVEQGDVLRRRAVLVPSPYSLSSLAPPPLLCRLLDEVIRDSLATAVRPFPPTIRPAPG